MITTVNGYEMPFRHLARFPHAWFNGVYRPCIKADVLTDMSPTRRIWYPSTMVLDTGADTSSFSVMAMGRHGLQVSTEHPSVVVFTPQRNKKVKARRTHVSIRIPNVDSPPLIMPIHYSDDFREELMIVSWKWLRHHFEVLLTLAETCLCLRTS